MSAAPRARLARVWDAFFARFGALTPIQLAGLDPILAGRSTLLVSPAAAGKTEAALAPLTQRLLDDAARRATDLEAIAILFVVPTRALANDLEPRLSHVFARLGLGFAVRTGDRPTLSDRRLPHVLVTTPESFDSLLCRRAAALATAAAVVLDELHLVDATYRGDQLRVLLRRHAWNHAQVRPDRPPPQLLGLSATVDDPERVAARYFDEPVVVRAGERRALKLELVPDAAAAVAALRRERRHKALWFCNRREDVESTAHALRALWPADRVYVHHGSLSAAARHATERAMREGSWGICVATTTLELGIDVGDISATVLSAPPLDAAAFQQRVGRSGRRDDAVFAIGIARDDDERAAYERHVAMAGRGEVDPAPYTPDLSVVVQQTLSSLFAEPRGIPVARLQGWLSALCPDETFLGRILAHLESQWYLERRAGRFFATAQTMDLGEKGRLHSNLPDRKERTVVDARSGRAIAAATLAVAEGAEIVLGGRHWRVVESSRERVRVEAASRPRGEPGPGPAQPPDPTKFVRRAGAGAFRRMLPPELR